MKRTSETATLIPWRGIPGWLNADSLWGRDAATRRSRELSPLYVIRYNGPNTSTLMGYHEFWELIYVFKGSGILHGKTPLPFRPGQAFLIPPGVAHREESGPVDNLWVGLSGSLLDQLDTSCFHAVEAHELAAPMEQLWLRAERRFGRIGPELDGLARAAIGRFVRLLGEVQTPTGPSVLDDAIAHLHRHFARPVSISKLAARYGYSEGYFFRAFKRQTGATPTEYVTRLRVEHASQLLRQSSLTISRVAKLVGYADPLYFSRVFKQETGKSPRAMRR